MSTAILTTRPAPSLAARLRTPRALIALVILMWGPLTAYVMFGGALGPARSYVLWPAIPATLLLYGLAMSAWRESRIAMIGVTLVFFWLLIAVTAPYLPLLDPNKPIAPFALPFSVADDFVAVGGLADIPFVVTTPPRYRTLKDLIDAGRKPGSAILYGSAGAGSSSAPVPS